MSQMMDPAMMGPPPEAPMEAPMGPPPEMGGGGGIPEQLAAALGGGGGMNSTDLLAQGPLAGEEQSAEDEIAEEDPLTMVRDAIALLRKAGDIEPDDQRSHMIDKVQADLQKILASESQKTDKLRSALGG